MVCVCVWARIKMVKEKIIIGRTKKNPHTNKQLARCHFLCSRQQHTYKVKKINGREISCDSRKSLEIMTKIYFKHFFRISPRFFHLPFVQRQSDIYFFVRMLYTSECVERFVFSFRSLGYIMTTMAVCVYAGAFREKYIRI